jgi:adenylate cyclase
MVEPVDGSRTTVNILAVTAIALAGFVLSLTPAATALDNSLMDLEWRALRKVAPRPGADDVIIVGIDPASVKAITAPPELWHEPLGRALERIAAAKPAAIGLDYPLPDRSYDAIHPGLDRALFRGIAAAVENGPLVVALNIDPRTRTARAIHAPFLALLGDKRLGIGLAARDGDGVTRRFSLLIPTEDGGFPTLAGRMCRALSNQCSDGLIDYALGPPLKYVSLYDVLAQADPALMAQLFRNRIVMIGEVQPYMDRIAVPINLAAWEGTGRDSPGVVVHAQTLRTALTGAAPREALRPVTVILTLLAAFPFLFRSARIALAVSAAGAVALGCGALYALHSGVFVPVAAAVATLLLAALARVFLALRTKPAQAPNIQHSG